jgi:predicted DNA-binding protein (UPF0251 family)
MTTGEVLAVGRIRQWAIDRSALRHGRTTDLTRIGWKQRRERQFDARLVRVLSFEQVFKSLDLVGQLLLTALYRDYQSEETAAQMAGISLRALNYKLPEARRKLADLLDQADLL